MKLITRRNLAKGAAAAWKRSYCKGRTWSEMWNGSSEEVFEKLMALGTSPEPDKVDEAIGNNSWTDVKCDDCGASVDETVEVGQEPDYESSTACLCKDCMIKALALFV